MGAIRRSIRITSPFPDCRALLRSSNSNRKCARQPSRSVAPPNLVYYQYSGSALSPPLLSRLDRRDAAPGIRDKMAALARTPRSMILRRIGALCIALLFALAAISSSAPAHPAHPPGRPCTVRTPPNLRRPSIRVTASNAARSAVTARKSWFFLFRVRIGRHRLYAAARRKPRVPRHSGAAHKNRPRTFARRAARAAPLLLIATVFP